jgi:hypothetical protein
MKKGRRSKVKVWRGKYFFVEEAGFESSVGCIPIPNGRPLVNPVVPYYS